MWSNCTLQLFNIYKRDALTHIDNAQLLQSRTGSEIHALIKGYRGESLNFDLGGIYHEMITMIQGSLCN